jgi:mannose/fructose/N-acetylgalactosamine-specific phosphotransferase system component IID
MMAFKFYVVIGIIVAVVGGFIGITGAASGNTVGSVVFLYAFPALALIIILWGFAGIVDKINDNTERIAEIMEYFTDSLEALGTESTPQDSTKEKQTDVSYE